MGGGIGGNAKLANGSTNNRVSREGLNKVAAQPSYAMINSNENGFVAVGGGGVQYGGATLNEDSASASSMINAAIRFDA